MVNRSTFQRLGRPTARARLARSTPSTKLLSTKPARYATWFLSWLNQNLTWCAGLSVRPGKATIRPKAVRLRWSNKACVPQEGQDDEESCAEIRMCFMQDQVTTVAEAMQALWVGRWQEDEGCCACLLDGSHGVVSVGSFSTPTTKA